MYHVVVTNRFEKEVKLAAKRGKKLDKLKSVMQALTAGEPLPPRNRDHTLIGNFAGRRECHIEPD
jgi:mRNA interferase YafQ